ncbi:MAG: hypothetical protein U1D55_12370 [Phycisphaerae bacterium]
MPLPIRSLGWLLIAPFAASALGQYTVGNNRSISWTLDATAAVAEAQRSERPMMFWVLSAEGDRVDDVERDQKRAFSDNTVVDLSTRFVPVRMSRSRYRDLLVRWGLSPSTNMEIVFTTPEGDKIDTLSPGGSSNARSLAQKMALVYRQYRNQYFEKKIKPVFEDEEAKPQALQNGLKRIREMLTLDADQAVVKLLGREKLDAGVKTAALETLATLSTRPAVKELLSRAADDVKASKVLPTCTPMAAEQMLDVLDGDDAEMKLVIYEAVTKICRIPNVKPAKFWENAPDRAKSEELQRVKQQVGKVARAWRDQYEEYR